MNFALTWALVRGSGGRLWLRFDDVDQDRCNEEYAQETRQVLELLGLHWDLEFAHQQEHLNEYRSFLLRLPRYVCSCSRQAILKRTGGNIYDGHCRNRNLAYVPGENAVRFLSPEGPFNDVVLWRREDIPSYHFACVADDARMGINLIVRGEDLRESTTIQKEISSTLPNDPFSSITFYHHSLLQGPDGEKLSKSRHHGELYRLLKSGITPSEVWLKLSRRMQLSAPLEKASDLLNLDLSTFFKV